MDTEKFNALFTDIFEKNGLSEYDTPTIRGRFSKLTDIILETNRHMNLTAITDLEKIIPLHYADCAVLAAVIPEGVQVLDVGCGGGFPTLPLAILRQDLRITALDATEKKVRFVADAAAELGLNVRTMTGRAEDIAAADTGYREQFDAVVSRAVARMNVLDELCIPFLKKDGVFFCMKGANGRLELAEAEKGINKLGGAIESVTESQLSLTDQREARCLIAVRKIKYTPGAYPRPFSKIKKQPL